MSRLLRPAVLIPIGIRFIFAPKFGTGTTQNRMMSALSKDGINWLQETGVRFQHTGILDPVVRKMGNIWRMYTWYSKGARPEDSVIVVAKSTDGLTFVKETEFTAGGGVPEVVKLDSGQYALYTCGNGIEMRTSTDGLNWNSPKTVLSPEPGEIVCDPSVMKQNDGKWVM